ncbi:MAG: hypothetical protein SPI30_04105 [Prevotella sp.]|nr:hypothetical protein [Prevotella sp.]
MNKQAGKNWAMTEILPTTGRACTNAWYEPYQSLVRCTFQIEVQKSALFFQGENMKNTAGLPCGRGA